MNFPNYFISATHAYTTLETSVPAPYLRKTFDVKQSLKQAELLICGVGFYELYLNGERLTKGALAPYISAPKDVIYYDKYDVTAKLLKGKNVIAMILGNGFQNNPGGYIWGFDKACWRGAPRVALSLAITDEKDETVWINSDETFKTANSPIVFDDYRIGERYDARLEIKNWNEIDFDDSNWKNAVHLDSPTGEKVLCNVEPIVVTKELSPVSITACDEGYLYDFKENCAGVCRLKINGAKGQTITMYHGEHIIDGKLDRTNLTCDRTQESQKDIYICSGEGEERYVPTFTYHGFQYVYIKGLTEAQATNDTLTYIVMNSNLVEMGNFSCSDETINALQDMTRRSTLANFYYFPTDCPQREKNGWTADAALSAEHTLLNLSPEKSYAEWLRNIRKAQADNGCLPGIVPTDQWGFAWGNGPAWDCVLTYLPYYTYLYRGDKTILMENAHAILRYLQYLTTIIEEDGLIHIGLGDWCHVGRAADAYKSPQEFTNTVMAIDICQKAAYIFGELDMKIDQQYALALYKKLRTAVRERLIDKKTMTALGNCQTSQAMAIFYGIFDDAEKPVAFNNLLRIIEDCGNCMDVGVLGARVLFHVLSDFGYSDLAYEMITTKSFPSYANWVEKSATTLYEDFLPESDTVNSLNHHFWGDISHWFIRRLAGINYNPNRKGGEVNICPSFVKSLSFAKGYHRSPEGKITSEWEKRQNEIYLKLSIPNDLKGTIILPVGYIFEDETCVSPVRSGEYKIVMQS